MTFSIKPRTGLKALLLGLGYTARALIPLLKAANIQIVGTSRTAKKCAHIQRLYDIEMQAFDGKISPALKEALGQADIVLSSISPQLGAQTPIADPIAGAIAPYVRADWVGYLSATSVYGDRQGKWVFEEEYLYPQTDRGRARIAAELDWLETGLPVHIFRLAGIYGPDMGGLSRNPFGRLREGRARAIMKEGHIVNRVHVDDIARLIMASIGKPRPTHIYNVADSAPAPPHEVMNFAATLLDVPFPPLLSAIDPSLSDMAKSFYVECKRISYDKARTELGWSPKYKNYRLGLMSILKNERQAGQEIWLGGHVKLSDQHDITRIKTGLEDHIKASRAETGCLEFHVRADEVNPHTFYVFERFSSQEALAAHQARHQQGKWAELSLGAIRDYDIL